MGGGCRSGCERLAVSPGCQGAYVFLLSLSLVITALDAVLGLWLEVAVFNIALLICIPAGVAMVSRVCLPRFYPGEMADVPSFCPWSCFMHLDTVWYVTAGVALLDALIFILIMPQYHNGNGFCILGTDSTGYPGVGGTSSGNDPPSVPSKESAEDPSYYSWYYEDTSYYPGNCGGWEFIVRSGYLVLTLLTIEALITSCAKMYIMCGCCCQECLPKPGGRGPVAPGHLSTGPVVVGAPVSRAAAPCV